MRLQAVAVAWLAGTCFAAAPAASFSIYGPTQDFREAARWSSGLAGGIRVGVDAGFVAAFGLTEEDPAVVERWVRTAFDSWENPVLQFDVRFGDLDDAELVLQALPGADPLGGFYGLATPEWGFDVTRVLTNGQHFAGYTIEHARIDIASERLQSVPGFADLPSAIRDGIVTRLLMHEIGHTIGLGHTNDLYYNAYYDTDFDPANEMLIDPANPFAGLIESPYRFLGTTMSTRPCGDELMICPALIYPFLSWDDVGGRDVLYPVPEPALFGLVASGATALAAARTRRRR